MDFFKKEWKAIVLTLCLVVMVFYMIKLNDRLVAVQQQNTKIISTFDSIESVAISSDGSINEMSKKVNKIENNVTYLVKKARRR